jgi:hypothetical protein
MLRRDRSSGQATKRVGIGTESPYIRATLGTSAQKEGNQAARSNRSPEGQTLHLQGVRGDGARRIRTADLLGAIQALCQLSYSPEMSDLQG